MATIVEWLNSHDLSLDLIAVWCIAVVCWWMSVAKFFTWYALLRTEDADDLGISLKHQKLSEGFFFAALGTLYSLTLYSCYFRYRFGPWEQTALRFSLVASGVAALIFMTRFVYLLDRYTLKRMLIGVAIQVVIAVAILAALRYLL